MSSLILEPGLKERFAVFTEPTELRDESGLLIGHFVPLQPSCPWEPELTEAEIRRRIDEPGASSLDDFWRRQGVA